MRQRVIRDLGNLKKLVFVDRSGTVLVKFHKPLLQSHKLRPRDCEEAGLSAVKLDQQEKNEGIANPWLKRHELTVGIPFQGIEHGRFSSTHCGR